ncbi:MAG: hypothetical protein GEU99_06295 [Luteitalea sp.]|nr:hypothetical protein [Luteitalea sp.]
MRSIEHEWVLSRRGDAGADSAGSPLRVGQNILNLWPLPNIEQQPGTAYNLEFQSPVQERLSYQPSMRVDYQVASSLRITAKYNGQKSETARGGEPNIGTIPGFNDTRQKFPWIHAFATTVNYNVNSTTFLEATYGVSQNRLGTPIITEAANRFNSGLGDLPLLFRDAGIVDSRFYNFQALDSLGAPFFNNGRIELPPTFQWGSLIGNAPPNLSYPPWLNINRTQDLAVSLTKVMGQHHIKAGFYLNHSYKAQNLSQGGGAPFQGELSFDNDTNNPIDTGFAYANAALGIFSSYQQQSRFVEGSYIYNNIEWYVQDNWKASSRLTLDYGLRFTHQQPQYDQFSQGSNFFVDQWSAAQAPVLYTPACAAVSPCAANDRQARNPVTRELLGAGSAALIGQIVPETGNALNGIRSAGDGISEYNYKWPTLAFGPRVGAAYDLTGDQRIVLRGSAGLFFDRPYGDTVFAQSGNPPNSTSTIVRYGQLQRLGTGGLTSQGVPQLITYRYDNDSLPSSAQWNVGLQMPLFWASTFDIAYIGQRAFNVLRADGICCEVQSTNLNAIDIGAAFLLENQDPTMAPSGTPGETALPAELLRPYRGYGNIMEEQQSFWRLHHSLQTSFQRRFTNGISAGVNWTLTLSDVGTTGVPLRLQHDPDGSISIRDDQGEFNELMKDQGTRRHILKGHFVWDLPDLEMGSGPARVLQAVVNDWQLSGIYTGASGAKYDIGYGYQSGGASVNLTGSPDYGARIRIVGDPGRGCSGDQYRQFNTEAFAGPVSPSVGLESGQNYMTGCWENIWDLAIARNIRLGGRRNLQVRLDMFNAFNTVVYNARETELQLRSPTDQTIRNAQFGPDGSLDQDRLRPADAGFGAATGALPLREVQLQVRFSF